MSYNNICDVDRMIQTTTHIGAGFEKNFNSSTQFSDARVVVDGNIVTSRGPGSAIEFALELAEQLAGKEQAKSLSEGLLVRT